ncbi:hypothetical protein [Paenibacillus terrigena]|uniref:hypothetical protein n=1 Tax=Paenibacillus terrigena TaxID=369333 RepID=UPI00037AAE6D|nr:hypothetical protein [Paenibacillus terrigena]
MPAFQRIPSNTTNVVTATDRATAVTSLLMGAAPNAVNVGNAPLIWPQISKFDTDNNTSFNVIADPQFLWTQLVPLPGETKGFATRSNEISSSDLAAEYVIALAVFADNAVKMRIEAFKRVASTISPLAGTGLDFDLTAGSLDPNTGITTDNKFPYNWQNVRFYSIPVTFGAIQVGSFTSFVFSFEVANYVNNGATNTAGLAFVVDIYQSV